MRPWAASNFFSQDVERDQADARVVRIGAPGAALHSNDFRAAFTSLRCSADPAEFEVERGRVRRSGNPGGQLALGAREVPLGAEASGHQYGGLEVVRLFARHFFRRLQRAGGFAAREMQARQLELGGRSPGVQFQYISRMPARLWRRHCAQGR